MHHLTLPISPPTQKGSPVDILQLIRSSLKVVDFEAITTVKAKSCRSFNELMEVFSRGNMTVTQSFQDCFALCCAVHIAVKLDGDPLWIYLVGPPSSGKSTICELLSADERNTRPLSKFTGLVTGHTQGKSLVPQLQSKCVIVKDGTLLLESTPVALANVYGELRDIYDGSIEAYYRNGKSASFKNISFGMIIGITEKVYGLDMAALGERFLHCRLDTDRKTELKRNSSAIDAIFNESHRTLAEGDESGDSRSFPLQREYTAGFLSHLHTRIRLEDILRPSYTEEDKQVIQALADILACSRASAPKDQKDNVLYDSRPEASTRVVKQLARICLMLCYVLDTKKIDGAIIRLITKAAIDSSWGRQYHIIKTVALSPSGVTRASIATKLSLPLETLTRHIKDLFSLNILHEQTERNRKGQGSLNKMITCAEWIKDSFRLIEGQLTDGEQSISPHDQDSPRKVITTNGRPKRPLRKSKTPRPGS